MVKAIKAAVRGGGVAVWAFLLSSAPVAGQESEETSSSADARDEEKHEMLQGFVSPGIEQWIKGVAKVEAVLYDGGYGERPLLKDGELHPGIVPSYTKELTAEQRRTVERAITGKHQPVVGPFCYLPHHGFIFYGGDEEFLGHIEMCFMCSQYASVPEKGLSTYWDLDELASLLSSLGMPVLLERDGWTAFFAKEETAEGCIHRWARSFGHFDPDRLLMFYEQSESLEVVTFEGVRYQGIEEVSRLYREILKGARFGAMDISNLAVRDSGDTRVASFGRRFKVQRAAGENVESMHLNTTMVLRRMDGRWRIIVEHSSPINRIESDRDADEN